MVVFKKLQSSIRYRLLIYFMLMALTLIMAIFFAFEEVGKSAFKKMEKEKAEVMLQAIKPSIAMNLYLGFDKKVKNIIEELVDTQSSILGITVVRGNKIVASTIKKDKKLKDYFILTESIKEPNSDKKIGRLHIIYSFEHFNQLIEQYEKLLYSFMAGIGVLLVIFSVYVDQILAPLKKIAQSLQKYNTKDPLEFEFSNRNDEIGAISKALEQMHHKIISYSQKQEELNKSLEQKIIEKTKELKERLFTDALTSLPNRAKLQEDLDVLQDVTLMIINIDDFKEINDLFGHKNGDKILKTFAQKLRSLFSTNYPKIYRVSGDEFVLLFNKKMTKSDIEQFLSLLIEKIEDMIFLYGDKELTLRITIGVALGKDGVLEKADIALKKAKAKSKSYEIYNVDDKIVEEQYKKNLEWIKRLKKSIELDRVVPYFQSIINVQTLEPKGYESLVRIIDEEGRPISPNEFLPIAKKSRLYFHLTKIMIQKSCEYFKDSNCSFSINLSIEDILNVDIAKYLENNIAKYGVADRIILEVVESEGINNYDAVTQFLFKMKDLGCQIAIDDFGSGYSNFEHILKLPIDYIKIDGSLVKNIENDKNSQIIIAAIVDLAKKKGIKTVSEYVCNKEIFDRVKYLGVDYVQGYYFQEPLPEVDKNCLVN